MARGSRRPSLFRGGMGVGQEGLSDVVTQLQAPMPTDAIVQAVRGRPDMAAQVYSASLMVSERAGGFHGA